MKILALLLIMRKITLMVKFDKKNVHYFLFSSIYKCECGAMEEYQAGVPEVNGSIPVCVA